MAKRGKRGEETPRSAPGHRVVLRPGREKPLRNRHPWVFSGAVESIGEDVPDGGIAEIVTRSADVLAQGYVNRRSQIVARVLTFEATERIDEAFFRSRIERAVSRRPGAGATRLVNAESDGLPGLVVDRYGGYCVVQASTLGIDLRRQEIVRALTSAVSPNGVYERSDVEGRDKEGLEPRTGVLAGAEPPDTVAFPERTHDGRELGFLVDVKRGHKTGGYLDQSDNRRAVAALSDGAEVLNLFAYTGGFGLHAAMAGARHVVNVDTSADALALSATMAAENGVAPRIEHVRADVFDALRRFREEGRSFDVVVVDPPKFVHSQGQLERAARAYKDVNRVAFHVTRPGGFLATFSCSGLVGADLFQKIVWSASVEAKRDAQIVRRLSQAPDHPTLLGFPEGEYLKGLLCRVL
jgi:23S rRNA (cytosine1962-C5)-methyltransferase